MTDLGKRARLRRLFAHDSATSLIVPMDHGIEASYAELEDPGATVASLVAAGADGFIMRRGLARATIDQFGGTAAWIQRISGRTGITSAAEDELELASVEQALRNGADAVCATFFLGGPGESRQLPALGRIADECSALGMPFVAEVFPIGGPDSQPYDGPYTVADMRLAVRTACEEGADLIKTWYTGDATSFAEVVRYSTVPVLIAGGPKAPTVRDVLTMVHGAMAGGARGITMGRKIWQAPEPQSLVSALAAVIRDGAAVDDAMRFLNGAGGNGNSSSSG
ncbi:MAG TPA: 2-amino-3,7-dideoxy-D-threo-hept-6-ulosonate synthase [Solirubrobacteraceae bacterium]|nr:2-amino-3,7-dideoxy-D-threo-hept-6-ulosonate synthase [Solirubrobacteraceae bacterium]